MNITDNPDFGQKLINAMNESVTTKNIDGRNIVRPGLNIKACSIGGAGEIILSEKEEAFSIGIDTVVDIDEVISFLEECKSIFR